MAVLIQDDFNRANSATSLGSPVVGGPYTVITGVWGISANEAYLPTGLLNAQVTFPAAFNLEISYKVPTHSSTVIPGLMFRWTDANNHWLLSRTTSVAYALFRCNAGTYTAVTPDIPALAYDTLMARAYGDQIAIYSNGKQYAQILDQYVAGSPSVAGLRAGGAGTGPKWEDLYAQDQTALPGSWGAGDSSSLAPMEFGSTSTLTPSLYKGRNTALADESEIP